MSTATLAPPAALAPPPLRRLALPVLEPRPALRVVGEPVHEPPAEQGTLRLELADVADGDVTPAGDGGAREGTAVRDREHTPLPEARAWAAQFVQAAVEVAAGLRSASQLVRWATPDVHATLSRRGVLSARVRRTATGGTQHRPVIRTVMVCRPCPGVREVTAVVGERHRVRAVALRMEALDGRWRVTAFELG